MSWMVYGAKSKGVREMNRKRFGLPVAVIGFAFLLVSLSVAWPQPPESATQVQDPLLDSIKKRMGQFPRLDASLQDDRQMDGGQSAQGKRAGKQSKGSRTLKAAEWMLKSIRYLEADAEELSRKDSPEAKQKSSELKEISKQLRTQVMVLLQQ